MRFGIYFNLRFSVEDESEKQKILRAHSTLEVDYIYVPHFIILSSIISYGCISEGIQLVLC